MEEAIDSFHHAPTACPPRSCLSAPAYSRPVSSAFTGRCPAPDREAGWPNAMTAITVLKKITEE